VFKICLRCYPTRNQGAKDLGSQADHQRKCSCPKPAPDLRLNQRPKNPGDSTRERNKASSEKALNAGQALQSMLIAVVAHNQPGASAATPLPETNGSIECWCGETRDDQLQRQ
jgi:hypothetical protein